MPSIFGRLVREPAGAIKLPHGRLAAVVATVPGGQERALRAAQRVWEPLTVGPDRGPIAKAQHSAQGGLCGGLMIVVNPHRGSDYPGRVAW